MPGTGGANGAERADAPRGADPAAVGPYLANALGDGRWRACRVSVVSGGKSNLTYFVASPAGEVVLRRPPLGNVLPTAHDMAREYRVISALASTEVPVPEALCLCTDESVLGAPFYVMTKVDGIVARATLPAGYAEAPAQRRAIGDALVDVLVRLHDVDPAAVGLADFGRPQGFLARQVRRWTTQWQATDITGLPDSERLAGELDLLAHALADSVPAPRRASVLHGDYRLDNTVLDAERPGRIRAVLDWEMSTLGDPLSDVGLLLTYWRDPPARGSAAAPDGSAPPEGGGSGAAPDEPPPADASTLPDAMVTALPGFPTRAEVAQRYAARTGADISALPWYVGFGCFKLAVILAGVSARHAAGVTLGGGFEGVAERVPPLVARGRRALAEDALT